MNKKSSKKSRRRSAQPRAALRQRASARSEHTRQAAATTSASWPAPIPLGSGKLPAFPTDSLPPALASWVRAVAVATQTPEDLPAIMGLAACSAAVAKKVDIAVRSGWSEPLNLFAVCAMPSGSRKSAVVSAAIRPIAEWERRTCEAMAMDVAETSARHKRAEARLKDAERRTARLLPPDDAPWLEEAARRRRELLEIVIPVAPRILVDDITPAPLARLLAQQGGVVSFLSDEGGVFDLIVHGRSTSGTDLLRLFLRAHAGTEFRLDRGNAAPIILSGPLMTIGVSPQPGTLRSIAQQRRLRETGLLARFLYSFPEPTLGTREIDPAPVPAEISAAYTAAIERLLDLQVDLDDRGERIARPLDVSEDARAALLAFSAELEPKLAVDAELETIADWCSKLPGAVARIAGCLHMFEYGDRLSEPVPPVGADAMRKAVEIGRYLLEHSRKAFQVLGADPVLEDAEHVLRWLRRAQVARFSVRECFESVKGRFGTVPRLTAALDMLDDHGFVRPITPGPRSGPGRPRSMQYAVNPATRRS